MSSSRHYSSTGLINLFLLLMITACSNFSNGLAPDISCLRSIKDSLEDPQGYLDSWKFDNMTEGFICRFTGVDCWHPDESKVLNIRLSDMGLKGVFPRGLQNCTSLAALNMSSNDLYGPIPSDISKVIGYVTVLDLSFNKFTGEIPSAISNCSYLNVLKLENNRLSGQIPPQIATKLSRLREFSFANNSGLCGAPLTTPCKLNRSRSLLDDDEVRDLFICGFGVGYGLFSILATFLVFFFLPTMPMKIILCFVNKKDARKEKKQESIHRISMLENLASRMSFVELRNATNGFNTENIISWGRMGKTYEASLPNGWSLAIRRLHDWYDFDQFVSEILALGRVRHQNVVPLLGFSLELTEKLLVYTFMSNGNLHELLHSNPKGKNMGWPLTFKIAVGIARGLSWLHHNRFFQVAHLNLRSKYILLDQNFEPKISNFGYAKFLVKPNGDSSSSWSFLVENKILDPDLLKKDVYCFGMILLELITGMVPFEIVNLSKNGNVASSCCDHEFLIRKDGHDEERLRLLRIADECVASCASQRPTMLQVYKAIQAIRDQDAAREAHTIMCVDEAEN